MLAALIQLCLGRTSDLGKFVSLNCGPDAFLQHCQDNDLLPLFAFQWQNDTAAKKIFGENLRRLTLQLAARELGAKREINHVLTLCQQRQLKPLILKGTALAYSFYPHPATRPRCDTDILLPAADLNAMDQVLQELGYQENMSADGDEVFGQRSFSRLDENQQKHTWDVHTHLSRRRLLARSFSYDELYARAQMLPSLSSHALALSNADALGFAALHWAGHHQFEPYAPWMIDIHLLAALQSTVDEAYQNAEKKGYSTILTTALDRVKCLAPVKTQTPRKKEVSARLYALGPRNNTTLFLADIWFAKTWTERLGLLKGTFFPRRAYMEAYALKHGRTRPFSTLSHMSTYLYRIVKGSRRWLRPRSQS